MEGGGINARKRGKSSVQPRLCFGFFPVFFRDSAPSSIKAAPAVTVTVGNIAAFPGKTPLFQQNIPKKKKIPAAPAAPSPLKKSHFPRIFPEFLTNLPRISPEFPPIFSRISQEFFLNFSRIFPEFPPPFFKPKTAIFE